MNDRRFDEMWGEIKGRVRRILKKDYNSKEEMKRRSWWDKECKEEKNKVKRELKR